MNQPTLPLDEDGYEGEFPEFIHGDVVEWTAVKRTKKIVDINYKVGLFLVEEDGIAQVQFGRKKLSIAIDRLRPSTRPLTNLKTTEYIKPAEPEIKIMVVTSAPHINTLWHWASPPYRGSWETASDKKVLFGWKYTMVANYLIRRNIDPKGLKWGNRHLLHQIGNEDRVNEMTALMKERGLDKLHGLDIEFTKTSKPNEARK